MNEPHPPAEPGQTPGPTAHEPLDYNAWSAQQSSDAQLPQYFDYPEGYEPTPTTALPPPGFPMRQPAPGFGPPGFGYGPVPVRPRTNGMATAALITSIIAFIGLCFGVGMFIGLVSLVLAIVALNQIKRTNEAGRGLAIAAIVISIISIVLGAVEFAAILFVMSLGPEGLV